MSSYFDHYRRVNDLSEAGRRGAWAYFDKTIGPALLPPKDQPRILDVGCGVGMVLEWLRARGYPNAAGVDADEGQVAFARGLGLDVTHAGDTLQWLRGQPPAQLVILKDVLEHIPYDESIEVLRVAGERLAPGGQMYIAVPNANAQFAARWRYIDSTHRRSYTEHSLQWDLLRAGLAPVTIADDTVWAPASALAWVQLTARAAFRVARRIEAIAEFGREGIRMPLGLNLVVQAHASPEPRR